MPKFFIAASNIFGGTAYLSASDVEHLKALRFKKNEIFTVCDGKGTDYTCRLVKSDKSGAEAEILDICPSVSEPTVDVTVYCAYAKSDRLEFVVQKAVELGAHSIKLFPVSRCVSRPDEKSLDSKLQRWQRIALEAAKQSGRGKVPEVSAIPSFEETVAEAAKADLPMFFYEEERQLGMKAALETRPDCRTVSIITGPEGGFEPEEAQYAAENGMLSVSLGPRILRCETAPICALSAVMLFTNNL